MRSSPPAAVVSRTSSPCPCTQTKARSPSRCLLQPIDCPGFKYRPSIRSWSVFTACTTLGLSSVKRASLRRLRLCMSELRRRGRSALVVEELGDGEADGDESHQQDPVPLVAVDGGEVVGDHEEHERHR